MQIRNNNIKNELVSAALIAAACETYIHRSGTNNTLTEQIKTESRSNFFQTRNYTLTQHPANGGFK